ncbi:MAG: hypothetical protein P1U74_03820 [Legionellaceae bacterium]|nr:hypothetical protein [Legionellaceae bacterium]
MNKKLIKSLNMDTSGALISVFSSSILTDNDDNTKNDQGALLQEKVTNNIKIHSSELLDSDSQNKYKNNLNTRTYKY